MTQAEGGQVAETEVGPHLRTWRLRRSLPIRKPSCLYGARAGDSQMAGRRRHRANGGRCGAVGPSSLEDNGGRPTVCWPVDRSDSAAMNFPAVVTLGDAARASFVVGAAVVSTILQSERA